MNHFELRPFFPDEHSDPSERLVPPITQLLDSRIDPLRGRVSSFSFLDAALRLLHGCCRFLHGCCRRPSMRPSAFSPSLLSSNGRLSDKNHSIGRRPNSQTTVPLFG